MIYVQGEVYVGVVGFVWVGEDGVVEGQVIFWDDGWEGDDGESNMGGIGFVELVKGNEEMGIFEVFVVGCVVK